MRKHYHLKAMLARLNRLIWLSATRRQSRYFRPETPPYNLSNPTNLFACLPWLARLVSTPRRPVVLNRLCCVLLAVWLAVHWRLRAIWHQSNITCNNKFLRICFLKNLKSSLGKNLISEEIKYVIHNQIHFY